jgi:hypothetical protein
MKSKRHRFFILFLSLTVFPVLLAAIQSLSITGHVVDPEGKAIAGARIFMKSDGGGYRTTNSSANGDFALAQLVPDGYTLRVETPGFAPWTQSVSLTTTDISLTIVLRPSE